MNRNPLSKRSLEGRLRREVLSRAHLGLSADELLDVPEIWRVLIILHPRTQIMEVALRNYYRDIIRGIIQSRTGANRAREFLSADLDADAASAPAPTSTGPASASTPTGREQPREPAPPPPATEAAAPAADIPPAISLPADAGLPMPIPDLVTAPPAPPPPQGAKTKKGYVRWEDMSIWQRIAAIFSDRRKLLGVIERLPTLSRARRDRLSDFVNVLFDEQDAEVREAMASG